MSYSLVSFAYAAVALSQTAGLANDPALQEAPQESERMEMTDIEAARFRLEMRKGLQRIPEHMHGAVERYVNSGIPPGSFLEAVLANDLQGSVSRADGINKYHIPAWVDFVHWHLPAVCHGSYEAVNEWCKRGGLNGH